MPSKNVLNHEKSECASVYEWKGITLKDFDFGIFQYFSINFLYNNSIITFQTHLVYLLSVLFSHVYKQQITNGYEFDLVSAINFLFKWNTNKVEKIDKLNNTEMAKKNCTLRQNAITFFCIEITI